MPNYWTVDISVHHQRYFTIAQHKASYHVFTHAIMLDAPFRSCSTYSTYCDDLLWSRLVWFQHIIQREHATEMPMTDNRMPITIRRRRVPVFVLGGSIGDSVAASAAGRWVGAVVFDGPSSLPWPPDVGFPGFGLCCGPSGPKSSHSPSPGLGPPEGFGGHGRGITGGRGSGLGGTGSGLGGRGGGLGGLNGFDVGLGFVTGEKKENRNYCYFTNIQYKNISCLLS